MPRGDTLLLGNVLLNYWHHMTRLVRDLLYLDMDLWSRISKTPSTLSVGPCLLSKAQINQRKYDS